MTQNTQKDLENILIQVSNKLILSVQENNPDYRLNIDQSKIDIIFKYYEHLKQETKKIISINEFKQDRHKIASVFVFSILSVQFVEVVKHPKTIQKEEAQKWINYYIAILFANEIIFSFADKVLPFKYPPTTTNRPYKEYFMALIHSMNEDIQYNDKFNQKISNYINSLSNIFFLLEYITLNDL